MVTSSGADYYNTCVTSIAYCIHCTYDIEVLFVKVTVFILLIFATLLVTECSQNKTAVSDTLRLLSDF